LAEADVNEALRIAKKLPLQSKTQGRTLSMLVLILEKEDKLTDEELVYKTLLAAKQDENGVNDPEVSGILKQNASLLRRLGKDSEADLLERKASLIDYKNAPNSHDDGEQTETRRVPDNRKQSDWEIVINQGDKALGEGKIETAKRLYGEARKMVERGSDAAELYVTVTKLAAAYDQAGDYKNASQFRSKAKIALNEVDHSVRTCPICQGSDNIVPIVYGEANQALVNKESAGEVHLGGENSSKVREQWFCKHCNVAW
jgi:tetratricopeptide (TPR) repeat protein